MISIGTVSSVENEEEDAGLRKCLIDSTCEDEEECIGEFKQKKHLTEY